MTARRTAPPLALEVRDELAAAFVDDDERAHAIGGAGAAWSTAHRHPVKAADGRRHQRDLVVDLTGRLDGPDAGRIRRNLATAIGRVAGYTAGLRSAAACQRCGRALESPLSVRRGVGPDCWAKGYRPDDLDGHALAELEDIDA